MKHKRYLVYKANYVVSFKKRHCCVFLARKEDLTARLRRRRINQFEFSFDRKCNDRFRSFFGFFAIDYLPIVWVLQFPGRRARLSRSCPPRGSAVKCTFCILKERNKSNVLE
jgi:hypothetical protein